MLQLSRIALGAAYLISFFTPSNALTIEKRALVIPNTLPGTWTSQGCYVDVPGRTLTGGGYASDTLMTDEACITYCQNNGFILAGTEYSSQCYCGVELAAGAGPAAGTDCSMPCTGNATEACGGPNRLNLFWSGTSGPQVNPGPGLWTFAGCYAEGTTGRALPNGVGTTGGSGALTVSLCTSACQASGFLLAGVEYSGECYCANTIQNGGMLAPDGLAGCNMLCNGNKSEFCGGGGRLNLYDYNGQVTLPPYTTVSTTSGTSTSTSSSSSASLSSSSSSIPSSSTSTTLAASPSSSSSRSTAGGASSSTPSTTSTTLAGALNSSPAISSTSSTTSSSSASSTSSTSSVPSSTSTSSVPSTTPSTSTTYSSTASTSTTSASSSPPAIPTLGVKQTIGTYTFQGCYTEATNMRALSLASFYDYGAMTLEECANDCAGYLYFGVEYGGECYCGNSLNPGSVYAPNQGDCSFVCPGSAVEYCGAGNRLELYKKSSSSSSSTGSSSTSSAMSSSTASTSSSSTISTSTSSLVSISTASTSSPTSSATTVSSSSTHSSTSSSVQSTSTTSSLPASTSSTISVSSSTSVSSTSTSASISSTSSTSSSTSSPASTSIASSTTSTSASALPTLQHKPTIGAYTFKGCYSEATGQRALTGKAFYDYAAMTIEECYTQCNGFTYFGVEYGGECYCGNVLNTGSVIENIGDCSFICLGNSYEYCGAGNRLEMYQLGAVPTSSSSSSSLSSTVSSSSTTASTSTSSSSSLSTSASISSSSSGVSSISSSVPSTSTSSVPSSTSSSSSVSVSTNSVSSSQTTTSSSSSVSSSASASSRSSTITSSTSSSLSSSVSTSLSLISSSTSTLSSATASPTLSHKPVVGAYNFQGCYSEATNSRALTGAAHYDYTAMTLEECATACSTFVYFGVEYGGECYCGNTLQAGSTLQALTDCNFICPGSPYEYCGAGSRLELYENSAVATASTSGTSTATSSTSTNTSPPSVPSSPPIDGFAYKGCYIDGVNGRILSHQQPDNQALTQESCVTTCAAAGYTIAGVEYGVQCFCDTAIYNGGALDPNQAACTTPCSGNANEDCGGPNGRMNLYAIGTPAIYSPPSIQKTGLPANWMFAGCLQDNIPSKEDPINDILSVFPYMVWNNATSNTPAACIAMCQEYGYNAAGLEYGSECFCGDVENIYVASAPGVNSDPRTTQSYTYSQTPQLVSESLCNSPCSGDPTKLCGSGNLMSYYTWNGTDPLYEFGFPTGNAAGEYSLLIGGVSVPLMTAQVITGKVTFTEKSGGTQESNGTGAYELDLSEINNFDAAWRTLYGLQTDVFCSAGLILPDKAGRQLTIGGWFGESNFGVRLYTPDGSAGVPGVEEWVEDPGTLSLQVPRWYPSALTMANGSILIVGGEIASNAAEQPTLELLPATGVPNPVPNTVSGYSNTTVYLDFLDRTAPFNLYPFICVLPTGGIFIAYYNEARILDEVTFATTRTLPNMPGSVNNPLAGRTYQLEGTMVLLPQYAPYTDHLQVLICGGSTAVGDDGDPIDNCISTAPEDSNPTWTIERMPSRRVMSCMAGLPDGTYLILNGAQHGKAGFGLGASPNYNAVLYDPTKPINQRMSIMSNTTVARLYHSEAIVLLDGRVLVSGSDPTGNYADPVNSFPEEYRVEVFTPPYLLSGLPQPTFVIENKDWEYNDTIAITVTSGNTQGLKVSMLGAVVSTHGNNMGQRTLFPNVVCAGDTCMISAPPNAYVCPPGWYMLFIIDGPTPSVGQFVRIGKDPANIGNWPQGIPGIVPPGI